LPFAAVNTIAAVLQIVVLDSRPAGWKLCHQRADLTSALQPLLKSYETSMRIPAFLTLASLVAPSTSATAQTLEITGELLTSTCKVETVGGVLSVAMGKVDLISLNAATRAGQKNMSVKLDCKGAGAAQEVGVRFAGMTHGSTGHLALTPTSTATNVGVAIYNQAGNLQKIGDDPTQWVTIPAGGNGELNYSIWYASPGKNATAGTANASGSFVVLYK